MYQVLIINTSSKISGAERSLVDVVEVMLPSFLPILILPNRECLYESLESRIPIKVVKLIRLKRTTNIFNVLDSWLKILNCLIELSRIVKVNNIDVIYANGNSAQLFAVLLKLLTKRKVVWHVRDNLKNKSEMLLYGFFSDKILCISEHIRKQIFYKTKTELVYNGIDTAFWKPSQDSIFRIKDELGINRNSVLVAHVGQLIPWKRHELFIDVANEIISSTDCDLHFVIVGEDLFDDFPDYKISLKRKVDLYGLQNRVSFLDFKSDIKEYLNGIDILVHLAESEPFGRVIVEAMALEKPVVSLFEGGPKEIIVNSISGYLVEFPNPTNIADKLKILIGNQPKRIEFGKAGREIVESKFTTKNLQKINSILFSMKVKCPD